MTQELSVEEAHEQRSELQYAKYKSAGKYSNKVTDFKDATLLYLSEIGFRALLTAEEEQHFSRLALKGDEQARHRMIESNLRLVVKIARRYVNRGLTLLDLIEEGNLGLIRAVEKFDPERGCSSPIIRANSLLCLCKSYTYSYLVRCQRVVCVYCFNTSKPLHNRHAQTS